MLGIRFFNSFKGDEVMDGKVRSGTESGGGRIGRSRLTVFFFFPGGREESAGRGEAEVAGTVVCRSKTVGEGGRIWQEAATAFPKGGGSMVEGELEGSEAGGSMIGGTENIAFFLLFFFCAGTLREDSAVMDEAGVTGAVGCEGSTVGGVGSIWQGAAAAFPKGSGSMVKGALEGAWTGGGRTGG